MLSTHVFLEVTSLRETASTQPAGQSTAAVDALVAPPVGQSRKAFVALVARVRLHACTQQHQQQMSVSYTGGRRVVS